MVTAVDFESTGLCRPGSNPGPGINWRELEAVVAGEGGHVVGRGQPFCLVYATHTPARLHQNDWTMNAWLKKNDSIGIIWRLKQLSIFECSLIVKRT